MPQRLALRSADCALDFQAAFRSAVANVFAGVERDPAGAAITLDWIPSPVGPLIVGATNEAVCLLEFSEPETLHARLTALRSRMTGRFLLGANPWLTLLRGQLAEYFAAERHAFELPLRYGGSDFQHKVWSALLEIPYGQTWSYLDLALRVADREATRAVGAANGMNPIAIVIPCHRVIYANGDLGGFGGGLWRKEILLDLERGQARLDL